MNKRNILITGSSRGIGLALAKYLNKDFNVYIHGRSSETILKDLCSDFGFKGYYKVDLLENNAIENLYKSIKTDFDILINNAGMYFYNPLEKTSDKQIYECIKLNTIIPIKLSKKIIHHMKEQKWGRIINIGSISGVMGEANAAIYSASKSALIGFTKALALEVAQYNVTVNTINPGWVDTDLITDTNLNEDFTKEEIIETIPQRRFVLPEEIAAMCKFLISDEAKTLTGQSINICAGLSVGY